MQCMKEFQRAFTQLYKQCCHAPSFGGHSATYDFIYAVPWLLASSLVSNSTADVGVKARCHGKLTTVSPAEHC